MTNREKFREVFGFYPSNRDCVMPKKVCKEQDGCTSCPFDDFWKMEYKECFEIKEKYND